MGKEKVAHFLMDGKCSVVQNMMVKQLKSGQFKLIPQAKFDWMSNVADVQEIFMQTSLFTKGACFGVGNFLFL